MYYNWTSAEGSENLHDLIKKEILITPSRNYLQLAED